MKNKVKLLLLAFCCLGADCQRCNEGHDTITIINYSEEEIVCQMIWRGTIDTSDTLYRCRLGVRSFSDNKCKLKAASRCGYWESDFEDIPYIQFLIVNDSIYRNIPCDTIRKYNMVLHRYQLTLEDLQRMNWVVNYPPE